MDTHRQIDQRSLALSRAVVARIDADPHRGGLALARDNCARWLNENNQRAVVEWRDLLERPWEEIRVILLAHTEEAARLRQNSPFAGVLTPRERWAIYREFS